MVWWDSLPLYLAVAKRMAELTKGENREQYYKSKEELKKMRKPV